MKSIDKIDHPPAAENWSRMQYPDVLRTAKGMHNFLKGGVPWNYNLTRKVARYHVEDQISRGVAIRILDASKARLGKDQNRAAIDAFFDFVEAKPLSGVPAFSDFSVGFPISRFAYIPIRPLLVTREGGRFVVNFLNPWSNIGFDHYQASLYMTILEKAVFSHTDFQDAEARVLFLPKVRIGKDEWERQPRVWTRGSIPLLSDTELNEQLRIFAESKELVRKWLSDGED